MEKESSSLYLRTSGVRRESMERHSPLAKGRAFLVSFREEAAFLPNNHCQGSLGTIRTLRSRQQCSRYSEAPLPFR